MEHYALHDLRSSFSSNQARLGTPNHVTEKLLIHVPGSICSVAAVYNRHANQEEMRDVLEVCRAPEDAAQVTNSTMTAAREDRVGFARSKLKAAGKLGLSASGKVAEKA